MGTSIYAIISVILVSMVSLGGVAFLNRKPVEKEGEQLTKAERFNDKKYTRALPVLVSFAVGGLFGDAFIHLLPAAFESHRGSLVTSFYIIAGLLFFFSLEKFVRWKHCHELDHDYMECSIESAATMILFGDAIHNFIDGMLIGASYTVSVPLGIATTLAVFFHEIPQEIGDFGVLLHSGYSVKKALVFNLVTGLTAVAGVVLALIVGPRIENFAISLLPFTAGGFIYIAGSDLIPELHHEVSFKTSVKQLIFIIFGIVIMALLTLLE